MIVCLQEQNIASSGRGQVEAKEATIFKILEAGEKNTSALQPSTLFFSVYGALLNYNKIIAINSSTLSK